MITKTTERFGTDYEIQTYDDNGKWNNVYRCETLEEVAQVLIAICNGCPKGNFPVIFKDGIKMPARW